MAHDVVVVVVVVVVVIIVVVADIFSVVGRSFVL